MGARFSAVYNALKATLSGYDSLQERISSSPGIPVLNSSLPFWTFPNSSLAKQGAEELLPPYADAVIIGSGISGTSIAKTLLDNAPNRSSDIQIVMLEARSVCSGATGRNGGHICPNIYNEYAFLKNKLGAEAAMDILRYRLAHIKAIIDVAEEENLSKASQARVVDDYDAYMHPDLLKNAKEDLERFLKESPEDLHEDFSVVDDENLGKLQLSSSIRGCIKKPGASIHAYRFVTGLLSNLLSNYSNFRLFTLTPCTNIRSADGCYYVTTPKGEIKTLHVIHATNAWSSHLLPGLRKKIVPFRAHMSAQRPGKSLATPSRSRAFVFYPTRQHCAYDYLTQLLPPDDSDQQSPPTHEEMMYGGGADLGGTSGDTLIDNLGISDDSDNQFQIEAYLSGSLERYFAEGWGAEGVETENEANYSLGWGRGRVKAIWSGIIGMSADLLPWVGRIPKIASGRSEPVRIVSTEKGTPASWMAAPGEWISAGFSGEGMVHAWLCGKALAYMVLGDSDLRPSPKSDSSSSVTMGASTTNSGDANLPQAFLITDKRLKNAKVQQLLEWYRN